MEIVRRAASMKEISRRHLLVGGGAGGAGLALLGGGMSIGAQHAGMSMGSGRSRRMAAEGHGGGASGPTFQKGRVVDHTANGFNPSELLRDFDMGRTRRLASGRVLREWEIDFMQGHFFGDAVLDPPWAADPATRSFMATEQSPAARILAPAAPAPVLPQAKPAPAPSPALDPVAAFEESLPDELAKLRAAIAALDQTFKRKKPEPGPEPSYADLLSDSLGRAAG